MLMSWLTFSLSHLLTFIIRPGWLIGSNLSYSITHQLENLYE